MLVFPLCWFQLQQWSFFIATASFTEISNLKILWLTILIERWYKNVEWRKMFKNDMWKTQNVRVSAILMWCPSIMALNFVEGVRGFLVLEFKVSLLFEKMTVKLYLSFWSDWLMLLGYLQTYWSWLCKRTGSSKYGYNICGNPEVSGA